MDDKIKILNHLAEAIKLTRAGDDLNRCEYDKDRQLVYAFFGDDIHPSRTINVALDSGWAMIKDVVNNLHIG